MKLTRRFLALLLAFSMSLSMVTPAFASETETEPVVEETAAVVETETVEVVETEAAETETEAPETEAPVETETWVPETEAPVVVETVPAAVQAAANEDATEDPAEGTEENPAWPEWEWNDAQTEASFTVSIPAGETYYFYVAFGGMTMTVNGGEAIVVNGNYRMPELHTIINYGTEEASYTVKLTALAGTMDNPAELTDGVATAEITAGSQGYFYTYTAPADGTLIFEISAADSEGNALGWTYAINNLTSGVYGDTQWSDSDPVVNPAEIAVNEGDELQIMVNTYDPAAWDAPEGTVTVSASFEYPYGSEMNPITEFYMGMGTINGEAAVNATVYYNIYGVGGMTMTIADAENLTVTVAGVGYTADENGVISVALPAAMGRMPVSFSVTNNGAEAVQYAMAFAYPVGHMSNPEVIEDISFGYTIVEAGDNDGYFYTYTVAEDGYLSLGITYITEGVAGDIAITNNNTYANQTLGADGQNGLLVVPVTAGDVLTINVAALPDANWNYPAAEIAWSGAISAEQPGTTEANPINITSLLVWDEEYTSATASVTVAGGATGYFAIDRVGGMELSIDGGDPIALTGDMWNPSAFSITNEGEETVTYSLSIAYPVGTQMNPEQLYYVRYIAASLEEGNNQGYYFTYTAPEKGTVVLTGAEIEGVEYDIVILNENSYAQSSMYENGDYTVSMPVEAGDVLSIQFVTLPDSSWNYPAADIVAYGSFIYPVGHMSNPEVIEDIAYGGYTTVEEGDSDGYFYTYTVAEDGYLSLGITYITEGVAGDIAITNNNTYANQTLGADGQNGLVVMPVTAGDVLTINVAALPDANWNYPAAEIAWSGAISADQPGTTEANPINITSLLVWDEEYTSATASVTVTGGTTGYFAIDRVGGMELSIDGGDPIALTGDMWNPSAFSITNEGEETVTYSLSIAYPVGTQMNPEYLWYIRYIAASLEEGNDQGYYFTYTAPEKGTVVLTGSEIEGVEYDVVITNENSYAQSSMYENGDYTVSMPVEAGDVLSIQMVVRPDENYYYAPADIVVYGTFIYPVGHMENPEPLELGTTTVELEAESQGYFYTWTAEDDGVLSFHMNNTDNWFYVVNNMTAWEYGDWMYSDDGSATCTMYVHAGDVIQIQVNTYDPENPYAAPAGTISFTTVLNKADFEIISGKKLTLTFKDPATGKKVSGSKLNWTIEETYVYRPDGERVKFEDTAAYATLKNGTLTTKKCGDQVHMVIKAALKTDEAVSMTYYVDILPAATKLSIWAMSWNGEYDFPVLYDQPMNINGLVQEDNPMMLFTATINPSNANTKINWKSSNTKVAVIEEFSDGTVAVKPVWDAKKGEFKTGTVTITATAADGSGKKASFKVKIVKQANWVEILDKDGNALPVDEYGWKYINAEAGTTVQLTAKADLNKKVTWSLYDEYVKVSKTGKLTIAANTPDGWWVTVYAEVIDGGYYWAGDSVEVYISNDNPPAESVNICYLDGEEAWSADIDVSGVTSAEEVPVLTYYLDTAPNANAAEKATWKSSKTSVAKVSKVYWHEEAEKWAVDVTPVFKNGKCATGTTTITATVDGLKDSITLTFLRPITEMEIVPTKDTVKTALTMVWDPYAWPDDADEPGAYVEMNAIYATAGQSLSLKVETNEGVSNKGFWWHAYEYIGVLGRAIKISTSGKLTIPKDIVEETVIWVEAAAKDGSNWTKVPVIVSPKAVNVHLRADFEGWGWNMMYVSNTTKTWDVNDSETIQLSALVYPFDASQDVKWTVSNKSIATVDEDGLLIFTGKKFGKLTVTATAQDGSKVKTSFTLNVVKSVQSIDWKENAVKVVAAGKSLDLSKQISIDPSNATNKKLTWEIVSENTIGATISKAGKLTTKANKSDKIEELQVLVKAQDGFEAEKTLTVLVYPVQTKSVTVSAAKGGEALTGKQTLAAGNSLIVWASSDPVEGTAGVYTCKTNNAKVATVVDNGDGSFTITANAKGSATITITSADGCNKSAKVSVTVNPAE